MIAIDTTAIDGYAQEVLSDRSMSPAERAQNVAAAMHVYVMTEMRLPVATALPLSEEVFEAYANHLEVRAGHMMNDLYEKSFEAYEALERLAPEADSVMTEGLSDEDFAQYEPSADDEPPTVFERNVMARLEAERQAGRQPDLTALLPPRFDDTRTEGERDAGPAT